MKKTDYIAPEAEIELLCEDDLVLVSIVSNGEKAQNLEELSYNDIKW